MTILSYSGTSYEVLLASIAAVVHTNVVNNKIIMPAAIGAGYLEVVNLPMGIQALISSYSIKDEFCVIRQKSSADIYNLRLEVVDEGERTLMMVDETIVHPLPKAYVYLNSVHYSLSYKTKQGIKTKSLNLRFNREVLENFTGYTNESELLFNSVTNNINRDKIIPASAKMLQLMDEIFQFPQDDPGRSLKIFNRSLLITECFFDALRAIARPPVKNNIAVSSAGYERMEEIEKLITADLRSLPPTQDQLAAIAQMSVSKLKYTFKRVYGTGVYSYFQKERMRKALELLQDGHSIGDTADKLGFRDKGNFTRNFKKEFKLAPGKVLQQ